MIRRATKVRDVEGPSGHPGTGRGSVRYDHITQHTPAVTTVPPPHLHCETYDPGPLHGPGSFGVRGQERYRSPVVEERRGARTSGWAHEGARGPVRSLRTGLPCAVLTAVAVLTLGACGAGVPAPGSTAPSGTTAADSEAVSGGVESASSAASAPATVMEVRIGSGPDTGSHQAVSSTVTCTHGLAAVGEHAEDSFGNQFADDSSSGLSSVELIVPETKTAALDGTDAFLLAVRIGKRSKGHEYRINTLPEGYGMDDREGAGTLRLEDAGAAGTVTISGRTDEGVPIDATVRCNRILGADGQPRE